MIPRLAVDLNLTSIFADEMVLHRNQTVSVWGTANSDAEVTVVFAGQEKTTLSQADGTWRIDLAAMAVSADSRVLTVTARLQGEAVKRQLADVLVGEVWLNGG